MRYESSAKRPKSPRTCGCPVYRFLKNKMDEGTVRIHHHLTCRHWKSKFFGWEKV